MAEESPAGDRSGVRTGKRRDRECVFESGIAPFPGKGIHCMKALFIENDLKRILVRKVLRPFFSRAVRRGARAGSPGPPMAEGPDEKLWAARIDPERGVPLSEALEACGVAQEARRIWPFPVAHQLVVPMYGINRFFRHYGTDDYFQLLKIFPSLIHPPGVTFKLLCIYGGEHLRYPIF